MEQCQDENHMFCLIYIVSKSHPEKSRLHPLDPVPDISLLGFERPVLGVEHPELLLVLFFLGLLPLPVEFTSFAVRFGFLGPRASHTGVDDLFAMWLDG